MFRVDLARRSAFCALTLLCLCLALGKAGAAAPPASSPSPQRAPAPVTAQERTEVTTVIQDLYKAWVARDLERILSLEHLAIESSAADYEKRGKGKADDVRESFRGCTNDLLTAKGFKMKPLHLTDVEFRREGDLIVVSSAIPIIATESSFEVGEPGTGQLARMVISKLVFRKAAKGYEIVKMDLHG